MPLTPVQQPLLVFGILWVLVAIASIIFGVFILIWVYRDAQRRGMNGALWLIIVLIGNIVGLIIYLIVREPEILSGTPTQNSGVRYCRYCGSPMPSDSRFCPKCGKAVV